MLIYISFLRKFWQGTFQDTVVQHAWRSFHRTSPWGNFPHHTYIGASLRHFSSLVYMASFDNSHNTWLETPGKIVLVASPSDRVEAWWTRWHQEHPGASSHGGRRGPRSLPQRNNTRGIKIRYSGTDIKRRILHKRSKFFHLAILFGN